MNDENPAKEQAINALVDFARDFIALRGVIRGTQYTDELRDELAGKFGIELKWIDTALEDTLRHLFSKHNNIVADIITILEK